MSDEKSGVGKVEELGIAAELQRAFKLNYSPEHKDLLSKNYDRLTFAEQFGYGTERDKERAKTAEFAMAKANFEISARSMSGIAENGFSSWSHFDSFCSKLDDDKFLVEFGKLSDDEKTKLANEANAKLNEAVEKGLKTPEEAAEIRAKDNWKELEKYITNTQEIELDNKRLSKLLEPLSELGGEEAVKNLKAVQAMNDAVTEADLRANGSVTATAEQLQVKENARLARKELRDGVNDDAHAKNIPTNLRKADAEEKEALISDEDMFTQAIAAAKPMKDAGVENDISAPKPTETEMAKSQSEKGGPSMTA